MKKLETLKVGRVQKEKKREKKVFCELESYFSSYYCFITPFHLHFKDDF
jgi:hypothetical protein